MDLQWLKEQETKYIALIQEMQKPNFYQSSEVQEKL